MTPVIRAGSPDDIPLLMRIEEESFARPHWSAKDFESADCLVAELDGRIAGFLISREIFPGSSPEREILNVAVATTFRRKGIATALLLHQLQLAGTFFLEVRESNAGAQSLYRKVGFVEIGRRPDYYQYSTETAIVMKMN